MTRSTITRSARWCQAGRGPATAQVVIHDSPTRAADPPAVTPATLSTSVTVTNGLAIGQPKRVSPALKSGNRPLEPRKKDRLTALGGFRSATACLVLTSAAIGCPTMVSSTSTERTSSTASRRPGRECTARDRLAPRSRTVWFIFLRFRARETSRHRVSAVTESPQSRLSPVTCHLSPVNVCHSNKRSATSYGNGTGSLNDNLNLLAARMNRGSSPRSGRFASHRRNCGCCGRSIRGSFGKWGGHPYACSSVAMKVFTSRPHRLVA